jgi:hypothetical protein
MFVGSLVAAIAATFALIAVLILVVNAPPPQPPPAQGGGGGGPGGMPPSQLLSGPSLTSAAVVAAALFTIAWVATIVTAVRDQMLHAMDKILSEYGEMRETEGYLHGYRQGGRPEAEVRTLHRVPPID